MIDPGTVPDLGGTAAPVEPTTVEAWAHAYVLAPDWQSKLTPALPPRRWSACWTPLRLVSPGRGSSFTLALHAQKSTGKNELRSEVRRVRLMHTFLHHELQAAELCAWAILAFPSSPLAFRRGLLGVLLDEVRHMKLYASYLAARGYAPGSFPVRDWFWERVPSVTSPAAFVATLGMGFEAANLDHAQRFAERFRRAGDIEAADIQERVAKEEIPHVRFAATWFARFVAEAGTTHSPAPAPSMFHTWRAHLPSPLSPVVMRGQPMARQLRRRAGLDDAFLDELSAWIPT